MSDNNKTRVYVSYEEYLKEIYPTSQEEQFIEEKNPQKFGIELARRSLARAFDRFFTQDSVRPAEHASH
jgi:hypothetical protein